MMTDGGLRSSHDVVSLAFFLLALQIMDRGSETPATSVAWLVGQFIATFPFAHRFRDG